MDGAQGELEIRLLPEETERPVSGHIVKQCKHEGHELTWSAAGSRLDMFELDREVGVAQLNVA